jgi:poly(3-hydroxybutyrate) depolymerase
MKRASIHLLTIFITAFSLPVYAQSSKLTEGFKRADSNGDGKLSADEVNQFQQLKTKLQGADKDGDGLITFEEFSTQLIAGARPLSTPPASPDTRLTAGEHTRTIAVGDLQRRYRVHVPKKYDAANPTPVVVVFHGGGGNPESMLRLSGMNTKSEEAGFIVVYPFGSGLDPERGLTFNGGGCCAYAMQRNIDDVGFTRELLDDLAKVVNVDADRVFATGLSNGGIMSHYVASELSDRIAAIAPVGGPLMMDAPNAERPVSVMHFHGTGDEFAPFKGGFGKGATGSKGVTDFKSVEHTIQSWVKANGCKPEPEVVALPDKANDGMRCTRKTWSGGKDGSEVVLIEIENGGHTWPGNEPIVAMLGKSTKDISANDIMWEFFQKHPRLQTEKIKQDTKQ